MNDTFATTEITITTTPNGFVFFNGNSELNPGNKSVTFKAGDVVRMNGVGFAFTDHVILGFRHDKSEFHDTWTARLVRPYVYVGNAGTTCPSPLFGGEDYTVDAKDLINRFTKIGSHYFTT